MICFQASCLQCVNAHKTQVPCCLTLASIRNALLEGVRENIHSISLSGAHCLLILPTAGVDQHDGLPLCPWRRVSPAAQHPGPSHVQPTHGPLRRAQTLHDLHGQLRRVQPFGVDLLLLLIGLQRDACQPLPGPTPVPAGVRPWPSRPPHPHQREGPAGTGT